MNTDSEIVVVTGDEHELSARIALLQAAGYSASGVTTFEAARRLLERPRLDLLITNLRLRAYNGLHLVLYSHCLFDHLPAIVIDNVPDTANQSEARRAGAAYLGAPFVPERLLMIVKSLLAKRRLMGRPESADDVLEYATDDLA